MKSPLLSIFPFAARSGDLHAPTAAKRYVSGHVIAPRQSVIHHFIQRSSARGVLLSSGLLRHKRAHADAAPTRRRTPLVFLGWVQSARP